MRLLRTEISSFINESMHVDMRRQPFLWSPFHSEPSLHAHPELELVFILEGFGKRIIGDKVEPFEAGDMVFVGSNVPHVWLSDPVFYEPGSTRESKAIVTYFNPKIFLQIFESLSEFGYIREMIRQSSKGLKIFGKTRNIIASKLIEISPKKGFEKFEGLLQIMNLISLSPNKSFIVTSGLDVYDDIYLDRLTDVIRFVKENLHQRIRLHDVARIAYMTEQSFCRFFRKRTKKGFSEFVTDQRVAHARELLIQSNKTISEIASRCGFNSSSRFCKVFKDHTGASPLRFRSGISRSTSIPGVDQ